MSRKRELDRIAALGVVLCEEASRTGTLPRGETLKTVSREKKTACQQLLRLVREKTLGYAITLGSALPDPPSVSPIFLGFMEKIKGIPPSFLQHAIKHAIAHAIGCGSLPRALTQSIAWISTTSQADCVPVANFSIPTSGGVKRKRRNGHWTPDRALVDRALAWLTRVVLAVPVPDRTGSHFPDYLAKRLEEGSERAQFTEAPVSLIIPRATGRTPLEVQLAKHRHVPSPPALKLVALWDQHDGQRVRPPGHPETHGVVYMVDVWTVRSEAERVATEGERRLSVAVQKPSDLEHARNVRIAALQLYKYGRPEIDLWDAIDWALANIRAEQARGRAPWTNYSRLPYIWSPSQMAAVLTTWRSRATWHDGPRREWR